MNINASLSGIRNAFYRQDVTANNVANINTPGYKQVNVINQSAKGGGVIAKTEVSKAPAARNGNNVNLVTQMVNNIVNPNYERANVNVLRAQNAMIGSLIDLKA